MFRYKTLFKELVFKVSNHFIRKFKFKFQIIGPEIPTTYLLTVDDNKMMEILENNSELRKWSEERTLSKIRYLTIPTNNGFNVRVELILPPSLEEDDDIKYPTVIEM
jgi:dipeptidyl aminopeptidase/acylaminoacyl peptidase